MNPLNRTQLEGIHSNLTVDHDHLVDPDIDETVALSQSYLDQSTSSLAKDKGLSERTTTAMTELVFDNEEFFEEIQGCEQNPHVFPFHLKGVKHYKIVPNAPILEQGCVFSLAKSGPPMSVPYSWGQAEKRFSRIFMDGFENICRTIHNYKDQERVIDGNCHHFVNYLAFGMKNQQDHDFNGWYEQLPFVNIVEFDQKELRWGDIVQLLSNRKLKHSMFYIGDGKYINKHGGCNIFFQSLSAAQTSYPSDSVRIIRLSPKYHSEEFQFKKSY